jgi:hypothetical protein
VQDANRSASFVLVVEIRFIDIEDEEGRGRPFRSLREGFRLSQMSKLQ